MEPATRLLVILATYNEIESLPILVEGLVECLPGATILVIDDASPDGTGNWCEQAKSKYASLEVIHRDGKLGLGSATQTGFDWGLARQFELIAVMDADLSHDPAALAEMHTLMKSEPMAGCGVMIGSRYVHGGRIEGWPWTRKLASRAVNWLARRTLRLKTRDNSGSFRIYRRQALLLLKASPLKSKDYAYLEEVLWRLDRQGVRFHEFPIVFRNRQQGASKTHVWLGVKVFWQIVRMGLGRW